MDLTHRFTVPAGIEETWEAFNQLERIASCFPGATVSSIEGEDFTGSVKVKLGPIALVYNGTGRFVQRDVARRRVVIEAKGKDKRGNGTANATVTASFLSNGYGTDVEVVSDLAITGKPAQFGRGVIQDVSDKLLAQFVDCVSTKFTEGFEADRVAAEGDAVADKGEAVEMPVVGSTGAAQRPEAPPLPPAHTYQPPKISGATDLNVLTSIAPVLLKRVAPPLAGLLVAIWIVLKVVRRKR